MEPSDCSPAQSHLPTQSAEPKLLVIMDTDNKPHLGTFSFAYLDNDSRISNQYATVSPTCTSHNSLPL